MSAAALLQQARPDPQLDRFVAEQAELGLWPGATYAALHLDHGLAVQGAVGARSIEPRVSVTTIDTLYDIASVTKLVGTTATLLQLSRRRRLDLQRPLDDLLPELAGYAGRTPSFVDLMAHRCGLPAWVPLARVAITVDNLLPTLAALPPAYPAATGCLYSDLGPIAAGIALERLTGVGLRELVATCVSAPLGLAPEQLVPGPVGPERRDSVAPTEAGRAKEAALTQAMLDRPLDAERFAEPFCGDVHDGNAAFLGGFAGHAGLFATAGAVAQIVASLVAGTELVDAAPRLLLFDQLAAGDGDARGFGTQLGAAQRAPAGAFGLHSAGHTGFTGCSVWCSSTPARVVVLLSNRVHPNWKEAPIQRVRAEFHDLALEVLDSMAPCPTN